MITINGNEIPELQLRMLLIGLRFEVKTGMRLTAKVPKCSTMARKRLGLHGKPAALLEQLEAIVRIVDKCSASE